MSSRAACRLEVLGFEKVYDYELGISDWKAAALSVDGNRPAQQTAADAMRPDIPTCDPSETLNEVRVRVRDAGWEDCLVIDCGSQVVGRLSERSWEEDGELTAGKVMQLGPSSVRADERLGPLVERMDRRPTPLVVVTTAQGSLLGVVMRHEAHQILSGELPERVWADCECCPGFWQVVTPTLEPGGS